MQQIHKEIYEGLFVTPFTEFQQSAADSFGDTTPGAEVSYRCFLYEGFEKVLNTLGEEALSGMQLYVKGEDAVKIHDDSLISCMSAVKQRIIAKKVYRGRDGTPVIGILYLP